MPGDPPDRQSAAPWVPASRDLARLRRSSADCRGCDLFKNATQTVFGEGPATARVVLVGEQPGDHEDVEGRPFVGPASRILDAALKEAGIDRRDVYVTNAVKHFKWVPRGKRRIHQKPRISEMKACAPWLAAEVEAVRPLVIVALGATASQALLGPAFRLTRARGVPVQRPDGPPVVPTLHPSAVLRAPTPHDREVMKAQLVADLERAATIAARAARRSRTTR
jgi:DNA polymerase